ncbi:MAG: outer membrane beta-barrel protein [Bacteroidales bacterium]|nr:outer membrane beta-barrel protein [Bacteroidales bacterium]
MRQFLLIFLLILLSNSVFSQEKSDRERIMTNEAFILNIAQLNWLNAPKGMEIKPNSTEIGFYSMTPILGKRFNISLATGFGFVAQNVKSNVFPAFNPNGITSLEKIPESIEYRNNKMTNVYVDIPFELRIRTTPNRKQKNFKIAAGVLVGYKLQSYHKYQGEDYHTYSFGEYIKFKEYRIKNVSDLRYGIYGRIGYGKFSFFGFYSMSKVFQEQLGPSVTPYSIGISIIPVYSKSYYYSYYRKHILGE